MSPLRVFCSLPIIAYPFKGHCEQQAMRDEGVIYVAGHPLLNRRCTRLPGCIRLRNDLYCVEWGVKLYSLTHSEHINSIRSRQAVIHTLKHEFLVDNNYFCIVSWQVHLIICMYVPSPVPPAPPPYIALTISRISRGGVKINVHDKTWFLTLSPPVEKWFPRVCL